MTPSNIRRFDAYPRATDHVPQMIELTAKLVERGHAYEVDGNVYYDVTTFPAYGTLSNQSLDAMRAGHRVDVDTVKRNHQDFTLWRAAGEHRLMKWDSPWGPGFPGWHIECSAMSLHLLGERFDIHTGGVDNIFPHHEDEIAQSEGAVGHRVVSTWIHGEHLLLGQAKMAKSARNVATVAGLVEQGYDPLAYRYLCFTARYRRQLHFTAGRAGRGGHHAPTPQGTGVALGRRRLDRARPTPNCGPSSTTRRPLALHDRFVRAVDDDLDFPAAITVLHEAIGARFDRAADQVEPGRLVGRGARSRSRPGRGVGARARGARSRT